MSDVTRLLDAIQEGDPCAADQLLPLVYAELRRLAHARMAREQPGQTLQPTDCDDFKGLELAVGTQPTARA